MTSAKRFWLILFAAGMISAGICGCQQHATMADVATVLPEHVVLPAGFYPLAGQYDPDNAADHYNGWPRYIICDRDKMVMVYVPSQTILMGGGIDSDEVPARRVEVNHFYIDLNEVTNVQFNEFAKSGKTGGNGATQSFSDYWVPDLNDDHPVRGVTWDEAMDYCWWAGRTLPTEAQWEAAARGNDGRIYPWGNDEQVEQTIYVCNYRSGIANFDGYEYTAPVMNFAAGVSPFGAFNMAGNVWEWCADYYDPGRYAYPTPADPPLNLERGPKPFGDTHYPNPMDKYTRDSRIGPAVGAKRVVRGGSFSDPIERCRSDVRMGVKPLVRRNNVGFRGVLPLPPENMYLAADETN